MMHCYQVIFKQCQVSHDDDRGCDPRYYIFVVGIQVDPTKIQVILLLPTPCIQTKVHSFVGYVGYYHKFIKIFS